MTNKTEDLGLIYQNNSDKRILYGTFDFLVLV